MNNYYFRFLISCILIYVFFVVGCDSKNDTRIETKVNFLELNRNSNKYFGNRISIEGYIKEEFSVVGEIGAGIRLYEHMDQDFTDRDKITLLFDSQAMAEKAINLNGEKVEIAGLYAGGSGEMVIVNSRVNKKPGNQWDQSQ